MYRRIEDFLQDWTEESGSTLRVLRELTDESLEQRVTPDGRSIGTLAWHLVGSLGVMAGKAGLTGITAPGPQVPAPAHAATIADAYGKAACSLAGAVPQQWTDDVLPGEVQMYVGPWTRGRVLSMLIRHQAHHRGQITVLMRQAGLVVPGCYGPSREERAEMGLPAVE